MKTVELKAGEELTIGDSRIVVQKVRMRSQGGAPAEHVVVIGVEEPDVEAGNEEGEAGGDTSGEAGGESGEGQESEGLSVETE